MKKLFLIPLAALALASCSSDVPGLDQAPFDADENGNVYISFGLANSTGILSRADDVADATFENGEAAENEVKKVRIFFFNETGAPANVKKIGTPSTSVNYYDYVPTSVAEQKPDGQNVAYIVDATIVLNINDMDDKNYPTHMMAVINPVDEGTTVLGSGKTLSELQKEVGTYMNSNGFIMSNSIFINSASKIAPQAEITGHIYATDDAAKADPVVMYVERTAAKVRLSIGDLTPVTNVKDPADETKTLANVFDTQEKYGDKKVYVQFLGWNVTTTADKSYLYKNYDESWSNQYIGWTANVTDFHRSFWAKNPSGITLGYTSFNEVNATNATLPLANAIKAFDNTGDNKNFTYLRENAGDPTTGLDPEARKRSQVIIAAQLIGEDGKPLEFAEYALVKYSLTDINKVIYSSLGTKIYKAGTDGGRVEIDPATDIVFKTSTALGKNKADGTGTYYVYAQLANTSGYFKSLDATDSTDATTELNASLINTGGPVKIWKSGYAYYYIDIEHLNNGETPLKGTANNVYGQYGVVRNHVYNISINSLLGLGTPVYDPKEEIIPEKPGPDYGAIAAKINILAWRIVEQGADLEW